MSETKTFNCIKCGEKLVVDIDKLISAAEYAIDTKNYYKAEELLLDAKMANSDDYRIYYHRAKISLEFSDAEALFKMLEKLQLFEKEQKENEVTEAINGLMKYKQAGNGATILHYATNQERFDMVMFCVEHGSDVNATYGDGKKFWSPISIMSTPVSRISARADGVPYRTKSELEKFRKYLIEHGANDKKKFGFK